MSNKTTIFIIFLGIFYGLCVLFIESKTVLLTSIGLPLIVLILLKPIIGFTLLIFSIPLAIIPSIFPNFLSTFTNITISKLLGGLAATSVFIQNIVFKRNIKFLKSPQGVLFVFLFIYVILGGFAQPGEQTRETFTKYVSFLMFYYLVLSLINTKGKYLLTNWCSVLAMVFASVLAISQSANLEGWRPGATFSGPNYFAISLLLIIPIAFFLFFISKNILLKCLAIVSFIILSAALVLTQSRGAMIGFVFILIMLFWIPKRKFLSIFLVLITLGLGMAIMPSSFWERVKMTTAKEGIHHESAESTQLRWKLAQAGFKMIADKPIFGVGPGNFYWSSRKYMSIIPGLAHNMYIEVAAELGLVGFSLFLGIIIYTLKDLIIMVKQTKEKIDLRLYYYFSKTLLVGLFGFLISALFLHAEYEKFFWLSVFLTICLKWMQEEQLVSGQ